MPRDSEPRNLSDREIAELANILLPPINKTSLEDTKIAGVVFDANPIVDSRPTQVVEDNSKNLPQGRRGIDLGRKDVKIGQRRFSDTSNNWANRVPERGH